MLVDVSSCRCATEHHKFQSYGFDGCIELQNA
jgi:hypothetical protein